MGASKPERPAQLAAALAQALPPLASALADEPGLDALRLRFTPGDSREQFAEAWAQTLVYTRFVALLWGWPQPYAARIDAQARPLFTAPLGAEASVQLDAVTLLLERCALAEMFAEQADPALYFFERLLEAAAPAQRHALGVYYTPAPLVRLVVARVDHALRTQLGLPEGLADTTTWAQLCARRDIPLPAGVATHACVVEVLDPAAGTGAFLLEVIEQVHATVTTRYASEGLDARARRSAWQDDVRARLLPRLQGIEVMLAPWVVALLRLRAALEHRGFEFRADETLALRLGDALVAPQPGARRQPTVILGNPPFARERAETQTHEWVRETLLDEYIEPARASGAGGHAKNLYNLYVYFWRWASWALFERAPGPGIIAFVTASSYLRGPGFVGMRASMRAQAKQLEIIDLEGEPRGTRASANVFQITTPVCVGLLIATQAPAPADANVPAELDYVRVEGSREEKLAHCDAWASGLVIPWTRSRGARPHAPLIHPGDPRYRSWPALTSLFPWQHSGAQFKRTWPIAPTRELLERRWRALVSAPPEQRASLLRETRDRKATRGYAGPWACEDKAPALIDLAADAPLPRIERYAYRPWDRQWCIADARVGDFLRPALWRASSEQQIYMSSLLGSVIGPGPAATASAHVPDLHAFRGSYGGRDVIPLWLEADAREPNLAPGLRERLAALWGRTPAPDALFCYVYAVLANPSYVARFGDELQIPGPRVPVSARLELFERGVALGRRMLQRHCYGQHRARHSQSLARAPCSRLHGHIEQDERYPASFSYAREEATLHIGTARVDSVPPALWDYCVSGLRVVESWLGYRMAKGTGRRSSPLDELRPAQWTPTMSEELLDLIHGLQWTLALRPDLDDWLAALLDGPLLSPLDLGTVSNT